MTTPKIILSPFSKSRDQEACAIPLEDKIGEITANFANARPGYRDGVILVAISPDGFSGQIRTLQNGDSLTGSFKSRQPGETPRKEIRVTGAADPLVSVDAVLYHRDTLAEGEENSDLTADYEVVTFLTKGSEEDQPMPPETLMANHFAYEGNGGTNTHMTPEEFEAALRKSFLFWEDKAIIQAPQFTVQT